MISCWAQTCVMSKWKYHMHTRWGAATSLFGQKIWYLWVKCMLPSGKCVLNFQAIMLEHPQKEVVWYAYGKHLLFSDHSWVKKARFYIKIVTSFVNAYLRPQKIILFFLLLRLFEMNFCLLQRRLSVVPGSLNVILVNVFQMTGSVILGMIVRICQMKI